MQPANNVTSNWTGHIYNPPGVRIQLLPYSLKLTNGTLVDGKTVSELLGVVFPKGLIRITRGDRTWRVPNLKNPDDKEGIDTGLYTQYFQFPLAPNETPPNKEYPTTFTNGVIQAEGHVRIWGKLPPDRSNPCSERPEDAAFGQRLTVVSNGTIYVEGSLLKGEAYDPSRLPPIAGGAASPANPSIPKRSGLALLAQEYVTVNPTAYFTAPPETNSGDWSNYTGEWYNTLYLPPQDRYAFNSLNTVDPGQYYAEDRSLYVRPGGVDASPAAGVTQELYTQASGESTPGSGMALQVNGNADGTQFFHPWWYNAKTLPGGHFLPGRQWTYETTPLTPLLGSQWSVTSDVPNWMQFSWKSQTPAWLSKVAVSPLDVRIEAAIYAMNGSFFIIPGTPFNNDPIDTRSAYLGSGLTFAGAGPHKRHGALSRVATGAPYPFAREPLDIKLTILGAVTENKPASEEAQDQWSKLWGWTPLKKASGSLASHGGDGLAFQFDPALRSSLRFDLYGRPLPLMPRLPVGPDLVFSGEAQ